MSPIQTPVQPNIVVIRIDDARADDMTALRPDGTLVLQNVHDLITAQGTTFTNNFATTSLCCPSRASFFTGQYAHNSGVFGNFPPYGGVGRFDESNTLPVWLRAAGYWTAHIGKYMNGYTAATVPPGWDWWMSQKSGPGSGYYYNYPMNENGSVVQYGSGVRDYATDVFTQKATDLLRSGYWAAQPLFLLLDYTAPHNAGDFGGKDNFPIPAPRHAHIFDNAFFKWPPSFNETDVSDKPVAIQNLPLFDRSTANGILTEHRARLASLLAVDEGIGQIMLLLPPNTYVFFLSDNGYLEGEHRLAAGKNSAYEESARVPLVVSGPDVPIGFESDDLVSNIDMASTFMEITGGTAGLVQDGRSIMPIFSGGTFDRQDLLLENFTYTILDPHPIRTYTALRTQDYSYIETSGVELYVMASDPFQLESQHANPKYSALIDQFHSRLLELQACSGGTCK